MTPAGFSQLLARVEHHHPRATLVYARILLALSAARDRTLAQSDLSDVLGRGRDNSVVQKATARLEALGIVTREMSYEGQEGVRVWNIRLVEPLG